MVFRSFEESEEEEASAPAAASPATPPPMTATETNGVGSAGALLALCQGTPAIANEISGPSRVDCEFVATQQRATGDERWHTCFFLFSMKIERRLVRQTNFFHFCFLRFLSLFLSLSRRGTLCPLAFLLSRVAVRRRRRTTQAPESAETRVQRVLFFLGYAERSKKQRSIGFLLPTHRPPRTCNSSFLIALQKDAPRRRLGPRQGA